MPYVLYIYYGYMFLMYCVPQKWTHNYYTKVLPNHTCVNSIVNLSGYILIFKKYLDGTVKEFKLNNVTDIHTVKLKN